MLHKLNFMKAMAMTKHAVDKVFKVLNMADFGLSLR